MDASTQKKAVVDFLESAVAGRAREAAARLFARDARHHNPYFPAGMGALTRAMDENAALHPHARLAVQRVLADGDVVAVHSHVVHAPGEPGVAAVHLFRFEGERVAEMWDVAAALPKESPNADGAL